jgi:hypothetical protein
MSSMTWRLSSRGSPTRIELDGPTQLSLANEHCLEHATDPDWHLPLPEDKIGESKPNRRGKRMSHTCGQNRLVSNVLERREKIRYQTVGRSFQVHILILWPQKETPTIFQPERVRKQFIGNTIVGPCSFRIFARRTRYFRAEDPTYIPDIWFNICNLWDQRYVYARIRDQSPSVGSRNVPLLVRYISMQTSRSH